MGRKLPNSLRTKKALNRNVWKHVKYSKNDPDAPYTVGQILHVYPQGTDKKFIPCIPKPGSKTVITRVPYQAKVTFLGMAEMIHDKVMHFLVKTDDDKEAEVFMGLGCVPHLCNIPKRASRGLAAKPRRKRTNKKSPAYRAKMQAKARAKKRRLAKQAKTDVNSNS